MKVKVTLGNIGLVIPCGNENDKVERLLQDVAARFESSGIKVGELRIAELQTADNYRLHPADLIKEVITDGERLVALDYDDYVAREVGFCKSEWFSVVQEDFTDDVYKWVSAGLHEHNKLYIKFGINWPNGKNAKMQRLELFDAESLKNFAKDGRVLVGSKESPEGTWKCHAYFIIEGGIATAVELSVKSGSDTNPTVKRMSIKRLGRKLEKGEVTTVSSDPDVIDGEHPIPEGSSTGPDLSASENATVVQPEPAVAKGELPLSITQVGSIEPDQTWFSKDGFDNMFFCNFKIINASDSESVAISEVTSEIEIKPGEWQETKTFVGYRAGFYNYNWAKDTHFKVEPLQQAEYAVQVRTRILAPQFDRDRRAHKSLPQPLNIRITFKDVKGRTSVANLVQVNTPLSLPNRKKREESNKRNAEFWLQCDDTELETRLTAEAFWPENTKEYIEVKCHPNQLNYIYYSTVKRHLWQALQSKESEVQIKDAKYESNGCSAKVELVVDLNTAKAYALKFTITTTTSSAVGYYRLPKLPEK